jgi:hypothetical protein
LLESFSPKTFNFSYQEARQENYREQQKEIVEKNNFDLKLNKLSSGAYLISLTNGTKTSTGRFVKQ